MAVYRPPIFCPFCGEQIKALYRDYKDLPMIMRPIGDNFIGYENHVCKEKKEDTVHPDNKKFDVPL